MDVNCTNSRVPCYKDSNTNQSNSSWNNIYPPTYPVEVDYKHATPHAQGNIYYHPSYKSAQVVNTDNAEPNDTLYSNNSSAYLKDNKYYPYFEQYKYNIPIPSINNFAQFSKVKEYPNFQTNAFQSHQVTPNMYEENPSKSYGYPAAARNIPSYQHTNFYGYSGPTFQNQNMCKYRHNEGHSWMWNDYQNNRRLLAPYGTSNPSRTISNSLEVCKTNQYALPGDPYSRDKNCCPPNDYNNNFYNRRLWPIHYQYPNESHNVNSYDHFKYFSDTHNLSCCAPRTEKPYNVYSNYSKYASRQHVQYRSPTMYPDLNESGMQLVSSSRISPEATDNSYKTYSYKENCNTLQLESQDKLSYQQTFQTGNKNYNETGIEEYSLFRDNLNIQGNCRESAIYNKSQNNPLLKSQNLREFISSWNDDEEDAEKFNCEMDGTTAINVNESNLEKNEIQNNDAQLKGSFQSLPQIHVGITVDGNINSQFLNLPDIIIDIEKPKESEFIIQGNEKKKEAYTALEPTNCSQIAKDHQDVVHNNQSTENTNNGKHNTAVNKTLVKRKYQNNSFVMNKKIILKRNIIKIIQKCKDNKTFIIRKKILKDSRYFKRKLLRVPQIPSKIKIDTKPKTLKTICISTLNTKMFREYIQKLVGNNNTNYLNSIPKLSALCEYALNNLYENGLLVINVEENIDTNDVISSQCDINENLLGSQEDFQSLNYLDLETDCGKFPTKKYTSADFIHESNSNLKDLYFIHHEEVVPENYKMYEHKRLLEYLQEKYVQQRFFIKKYITKKILMKYKKQFIKMKKINDIGT